MAWYEANSGNRLWYEDAGTGTPIVFIHGWCMSSAVWRLQMKGLSNLFRVITIDLPGHGNSPPQPGDFKIKGCIDDIALLIESLGLYNVLLVGWSLGGMIALELCMFLRERLTGLILVAATPRFIQGDGYLYGLSRLEVDGMANKVQRSLRRALAGFTARMFASGELDDPTLAALVHELFSTVPLPTTEVALQALDALADTDLRDRLPLLDLPTLIVNGDCDVICLPQASAFLAQKISSSRQIVFAGCGHAPFLTRSLRFNSCLEEFRGMVMSGRAH